MKIKYFEEKNSLFLNFVKQDLIFTSSARTLHSEGLSLCTKFGLASSR